MKKQENGLSVLSLTMMALGTVIGGSFFLGSGLAIRNAGPSVILAYIFGGILIYIILFSLSEMTVANPSPGSFRIYAERELGKSMGFTIGWAYWTALVLAMSSEAVAVSTFIKLWLPQMSIPILGTVIIIIIIFINLLGTDKLSKLESSLSFIKLMAIVAFIVIAAYLIFDKNEDTLKFNELTYFPNGIKGLFGSMVFVIFSYAGFEIIGLAASETANPHKSIPRAIRLTMIVLVVFYTLSTLVLLPLIKTDELTSSDSPFVLALLHHNISWAGKGINLIMITAILSTMLAATFGLARTLRSLADSGYAFKFLKDKGDIPYRSIIFSGLAMLSAFSLSFFLPEQVYVFLVSSGGLIFLFTYLIIVLSHIKYRKHFGCPPKGNCQLPLYPFTSFFSIFALAFIIISMPFVKGQGIGLIAGTSILLFYYILYFCLKKRFR